MASDSILYGSIDCFCTPGREDWRLLWRLNSAAIASLCEQSGKSLLSRNLFSVEEGSGRIQVIHFGAAFKNFASNWHEWLDEFEGLLRRLYWNTARVHLEDEELGLVACRWTLKNESWQLALQQPPVLRVEWDSACHTDPEFGGGGLGVS
jgi:hypothetical protein